MQDRVLRLQAYRFALQVKPRQRQLLRQFAGASRYVSNRGLALQQEFYERTGVHAGYADLCAMLTGWKQDPETAWLKAMPSQALQQSLKDLESGWQRYFAGLAERPVFKKKGQHSSFRYPQGSNLDQSNHRIFLPKLGWVRYRSSRAVKGTVKNVTVSLSAGRWFVSIQTVGEVEHPVHPSTSEVGIDLGVVRFATLSDGEVVEPAGAYGKQRDGLRAAQQCLSRKKKFSRNWKKAQARVQRIHTRIANTRRDFLHKATTAISNNHAVVYVEDLKVKNMSRSAKGDQVRPGKNVRAKAGLNREILDQGWAEFRRQLGYKLDWKGGELIVVAPHYTSQTCPACGRVCSANRKTQAEFACVECGYREHADLVGAINVQRAGHARIACEVSSAGTLPAAGTSLNGQTGSTPALAV